MVFSCKKGAICDGFLLRQKPAIRYLLVFCVFTCTVKTWDGGDNVIDSTQVAGEWTRPERDPWEKELDRGRVSSS